MNARKHIELLGMKVEDRVTGFTGVVECLSFDLYGCIQATVRPELTKEKKLEESKWFDVSRLKVTSSAPVMDRPNFEFGPVAEGKHGPAEKPER
jgi:hypothetical protein